MAAPSSLLVSVDEEEYCRFERDFDTVTATVTATGVAMAGEEVTVEIVVARRSRDLVKATKTLTLDGVSTSQTITFYLPDVVDSDTNPMIRRGYYFIRATSVSNPAATNVSADFKVSLMTASRFRAEYLHGVNLLATNLVSVKDQPEVVTGVTISAVSPSHSIGFHSLAFNVAGTPPNEVRTLSWCGGPALVITSSKTRYTLRKGNTNDYIEVKVPSVAALPATSIAEEIYIEKASLSTQVIQGIIDDTASSMEDSELHIYLEPTVVTTEITTAGITTPTGTDIPAFDELVDHDKIVDALTYYAPEAGHWIGFKFPYYPLLKFYTLYGQVAQVPVITINPDWIEAHEKGGWVELVPINQGSSFNFIGLMWVGSLKGPVPLPNFWNFKALVGFRDLPAVLLELLGKSAAIDALTLIGQSLRPGIGSTSVSRDGISESISYINSQQFGPFTPTINAYKAWVEDNIRKLRASFLGPNMVVC